MAAAWHRSLRVETKRANLPAVLEILRQVLREPTLPADEFEIMKHERLARLEQAGTEPADPGLEPARPAHGGVPPRRRPLRADDRRVDRPHQGGHDRPGQTLYDDYLGAGHGELAIVGDFEPSEILPIVARALEGWKSGKPYARIERPYQPGRGRRARRS